jgi:type 1 fimbria pilin
MRMVVAVFLSLVFVVLAADASAATPNHSTIAVTGPTTEIVIGTAYTYTVKIVPAKSYPKTVFSIGLTGCDQRLKYVHLTAGHQWISKVVVTYEALATPTSLELGMTGIPRGAPYKLVARKRLTISFAAGQTAPTGFPKCRSLKNV